MKYIGGKITAAVLGSAATAADLTVKASASASAVGTVNPEHAVIAAGAALAAGALIYINRHRRNTVSYE